MADLRPPTHLRACQEETVTAGSCPPPGPSRALPVGVIGCGHAASQSMRCPLAYHLTPSSSSVVLGGFCAHSLGAHLFRH